MKKDYKKMAKDLGIAITNLSLFGLKSKEELKRKYQEDKHLNNIPLKYFTSLAISYLAFNRGRLPYPVSIGELTCIYKELLREIVEKESI